MPTRKPTTRKPTTRKTPPAPSPEGVEGDRRWKVVRDTREQQGWTFRVTEECGGTVSGALKTGDYAILGHENLFVVERKGRCEELVGNLREPRFERELQRMQDQIKHPYVVLEFDLQDITNWPRSSSLPAHVKSKIKTTGAYILKQLTELMVKYPKVHWIFGGQDGAKIALSLFKRVYELEIAEAD